jgi:hypothetical protein
MVQLHVGALLAGPDNFIFSRNEHIAAMALNRALPTIYQWRGFADSGGLMTYGAAQTDVYRQMGIYGIARSASSDSAHSGMRLSLSLVNRRRGDLHLAPIPSAYRDPR